MSVFTGTLALTRLAIRRDRIQLPVWILGLTLMLWVQAASIAEVFPTARERAAQAAIEAGNAVSLLFNGPALGSSLGAIITVETSFLVIVFIPVMSLMAVVRHTRQNEETGRSELIGATVVGRYASLTSGLIVAVGANLVLAALFAAVLVGNDLPLGSSALAALSAAAAGISFAAVAAVTAQIAESSRAANGLALAVLGVAFLLRAIGDTVAEVTADGVRAVSAWPSWLSPVGWAQQTRPFDDDRWWVLGLPAILFVGLVRVAFTLTSHRDFGTGMLPTRPGPAAAARSLLSPLGLAWRLQRGVLIAWAAGVAVLGLTMGVIADAADEILSASEQMREAIEQMGGGAALTDTFFAVMAGFAGISVAGYAVQSLLRLRSEESSGRVEPLLATAVSRPEWMLSHIACALAGTVGLLMLFGVTSALGYGLVTSDFSDSARIIGAAAVQMPAALALGAFVVAVFGLVPRISTALAWSGLAICLVLGQIGELLQLPQAVLNLSPFGHVPAYPAEDATAAPVVALAAVTVALGVIGLATFRRRDLVDR